MQDSRVRVYLAMSIDGFIAGPGGDLSWLPDADPSAEQAPVQPGALSYDDFIADVGALLMGRITYDTVRGFDVPWPYGDMPVLVASSRPLDSDPPPHVRRVQGPIQELVAQAKQDAGDLDVYLDGGVMIRQAAEADLIDEITLTVVPVVLGAGHTLFAGMQRRYPLEFVAHHDYPGGLVQLRTRPTGR